jgi:protein-S-isoprenylcysteine O-methyltransferase Ste14
MRSVSPQPDDPRGRVGLSWQASSPSLCKGYAPPEHRETPLLAMALFTYGQPETGSRPRAALILAHALLVLGVARILLGSGLALRASGARQQLLLGASLLQWLRITLTLTWLLRRRLAWPEAVTVFLGLTVYQLGFSWLGASGPSDLGETEVFGLTLFLAGSALNTGSEIQRHRFKRDPSHAHHLFTGECFRWIRHPNFLGDILWVTGWALLTRRWEAGLIVLACVAGFVTSTIPHLSTYLRNRYGEEYTAWEARTARLVPFVY